MFGYKISKINNHPLQDDNPFEGIKNQLVAESAPIFFDIGANHGQTIKKIKNSMSDAIIHGFEPSQRSFDIALNNTKEYKDVFLNNIAMGEEVGSMDFNEYSWGAMNSFLERKYGNTTIVSRFTVDVTTIDDYCSKNNVQKIHFLKTDTEGFELKVLRGARQMMINNNIQFVLVELFFNLNYIGQSSVGDIFRYLEDSNFSLVRFYEFNSTADGILSRTDALFVNLKFENK